jgi:hypothetical protein
MGYQIVNNPGARVMKNSQLAEYRLIVIDNWQAFWICGLVPAA